MTSFALNNLWAYLQGLSLSQSDREWLADKLIMPKGKNNEFPAEKRQIPFPNFSGAFADEDGTWVEESLSKFHKDWGGDGSPLEIAENLRRGIVNSRTVDTW